MGKGLMICLCVVVALLMVSSTAMAGEVNLSVAASLREVINELSDGFMKKYPRVKVVKNFGASGVLAKQIESGAPADVFISANNEWMDYLTGKRLVDKVSVGTLAYNTLVFAGIPGTKVTSMQDLVKLDRIAIGSPKSVPAGEYAMTALQRAGIAGQLQRKLVLARDVRDAMMYAERGEVDGAFVYRTDALLGRRTKILFTVPPALYPRISYPMALTVGGGRNGDAVAFYRYLRSGETRAILQKYGFEVR